MTFQSQNYNYLIIAKLANNYISITKSSLFDNDVVNRMVTNTSLTMRQFCHEIVPAAKIKVW